MESSKDVPFCQLMGVTTIFYGGFLNPKSAGLLAIMCTSEKMHNTIADLAFLEVLQSQHFHGYITLNPTKVHITNNFAGVGPRQLIDINPEYC